MKYLKLTIISLIIICLSMVVTHILEYRANSVINAIFCIVLITLYHLLNKNPVSNEFMWLITLNALYSYFILRYSFNIIDDKNIPIIVVGLTFLVISDIKESVEKREKKK